MPEINLIPSDPNIPTLTDQEIADLKKVIPKKEKEYPPLDILKGIYSLRYLKKGSAPQYINFYYPGKDLPAAILRAKRFCKVKDYIFIWVKQFITDIDALEMVSNYVPEKQYPIPPDPITGVPGRGGDSTDL